MKDDIDIDYWQNVIGDLVTMAAPYYHVSKQKFDWLRNHVIINDNVHLFIR